MSSPLAKLVPAPMPKYMGIREYLLNYIASNHRVDTKIPPENELCRMFDVTRPTVRNAIKGLVKDGFLVPRRGDGTFINPSAVEADAVRIPTVGFVNGNGRGTRTADVVNPSYVLRMVETGGLKLVPLYIPNSKDPGRLVEMVGAGIDAVLWAEPPSDCDKYLEALKATGVPVLLIAAENANSLQYDNIGLPGDAKIGRFIADVFFSRGHSRFVYVHNCSTDNGRLSSGSWLNACCKRMQELSGEVSSPKDHFVFLKDLPEFIKEQRGKHNRFSAIYAIAQIAPQIVHALKKDGMSVPEDISFLSYGEPASYFQGGQDPDFIDVYSGLALAFYEWSEKRIFQKDLDGRFFRNLEYKHKEGATLKNLGCKKRSRK